MIKIQSITRQELELSLKAWYRQAFKRKYASQSIVRTSYRILYDVAHSSSMYFDEEHRNSMFKVNKIEAIKKGKALLGLIEYGYKASTKTLWIHNLASSPNIVIKKTYKGIGTTLLLHAIKYGIERGAREICLYSSRDNFYRKFGFIVDCRDSDRMVLRLTDSKIRHLTRLDKGVKINSKGYHRLGN